VILSFTLILPISQLGVTNLIAHWIHNTDFNTLLLRVHSNLNENRTSSRRVLLRFIDAVRRRFVFRATLYAYVFCLLIDSCCSSSSRPSLPILALCATCSEYQLWNRLKQSNFQLCATPLHPNRVLFIHLFYLFFIKSLIHSLIINTIRIVNIA